jgi:hypothetical protein
MDRTSRQGAPLQCTFCHKTEDTVQKLIGTPAGGPTRAYICDECVAVCVSILEDDRVESPPVAPADIYVNDVYIPVRVLAHPVIPQLLVAIERWIAKESQGGDADAELAEVRKLAAEVMLSKREE